MKQDETRLLDMLIAARKVEKFAADLDEPAFRKSELHQSAIVRELRVIGEAARQISEAFRAAHPEIDWQKITGMRNRLVHEYFRVSLAIVWQTVQDDIPVLIEQIEPLVPPAEDDK
jgi:uncharacterized protein with HEPN domain